MDRVASAIQKLRINQVVISHYFDVTGNEQGVVDADSLDMHRVSRISNMENRDNGKLFAISFRIGIGLSQNWRQLKLLDYLGKIFDILGI